MGLPNAPTTLEIKVTDHKPCQYCYAEGPFQADIRYGCLKSRELARDITAVITDLSDLYTLLASSGVAADHASATRLCQHIRDLRSATSPLTDRYCHD